jgi:MarR family transcriptional regulator for hemolysin
MLEHDFHESIGCWVVLTSRAFERALNDELAPHGITFPQWQVLGWLAFDGELTQAQLAQRMRVEAPTLVGILDRMERDGWISRQPAPDDRRKKLIQPCPKVKPIWETVMAACRRVRARALQGVEPEDVEHVKNVLQKIRENLNAESVVEASV